MGLLPTPATPTGPRVQTAEERRAEFDELSAELRQFNRGEIEMDSKTYTAKIKRAIDLAASFNQTTAGPKKTSTKIAKGKATPLTLSDL